MSYFWNCQICGCPSEQAGGIWRKRKRTCPDCRRTIRNSQQRFRRWLSAGLSWAEIGDRIAGRRAA